MDDFPPPLRRKSWRLPANANEFWALILSVALVFLLVQVGAPIIREFEFLDPKLRDYFIGISFAAFPLIHRTCKQNLSRFQTNPEPAHHDSTPWYVAGVMAAAVIFGWNQFVSFLSGVSLGVLIAAFTDAGSPSLDESLLNTAATTASIIVVLPLSAVAAIYAGILLNRHTRSHTFAAVALASLCFISINLLMTGIFHPEILQTIVTLLLQGGEEAVGVAFGMAMVGITIFIFGSVGVLVSRFNHERPVGRIVEAARKLPPHDREALAMELANRARSAVQMPTMAEP